MNVKIYGTRTLCVVLLLCLLAGRARLYAADFMEILARGPHEKRVEAMYHMAYAGSKRGFWYYVKYLDYSPGEDGARLGEEFRMAAAEALGRIKDKRAIPYLLKRYKKETRPAVKRRILFALSFYNTKEVIPVVQEGLQDADEDVRFEAIKTAAINNDPATVPQLKEIFAQTKVKVTRYAAAYALINLTEKDDEYTAVLKKTLTQKDPLIRYWGAYFLSRTDKIEAIYDLVRALEIENTFWVRKEMELSLMSLRAYRLQLNLKQDATGYEFLEPEEGELEQKKKNTASEKSQKSGEEAVQ
jgi:HEAT repeat protein